MMDGQWHVNGYFDSTKLTGLYEAAQRRESTRLFAAAPCAEKWSALLATADRFALPGMRIALGMCDTSLFQPLMGLFMKFENVQRFAAIITQDASPQSLVNAGVSGELFLLHAVELGLGGCWVSGTFKRGQVGLRLQEGEKIVALLALGEPKHASQPPLTRKRKPMVELCPEYDALPPALREVADYIQIAPSAMNLQPWRIARMGDAAVTVTVGIARLRLDLGIGVCHALLALGSTPAHFSLSPDGMAVTITLL